MYKIISLATLYFSMAINSADALAGEKFRDEKTILEVRRDDQSNALKIGLIKKEVLITDIMLSLSTFEVVSEDVYMKSSHRLGVRGSIVLKDKGHYLWSIEPDYAAVLVDSSGKKYFLLNPKPQK